MRKRRIYLDLVEMQAERFDERSLSKAKHLLRGDFVTYEDVPGVFAVYQGLQLFELRDAIPQEYVDEDGAKAEELEGHGHE